ncbi:subclass B3 metallo-beta-lactamase [Novosphingobium panipatense]|uniref:Metallo-beta-lactamase class B n=1 Tax=Novosphingobium panipatense TaxID=428991 RepID=A0ABY1PZ04_9SPHN|nr:subclass B3 metallo-beta-lactamase [Novosphingobium panipatense]SMP53342.1 metallo-beta-lactamase class B [Novosphingobium panipatense]
MNRSLFIAGLGIASALASHAAYGATPDTGSLPALAQACAGNDAWDAPAPPARIFGNTFYVGTCGISAILVTGKEGHVLVDAGVPAAAPLVLSSIRRAGIDPRDIRWIVTSHEHFDHVGALAALQKATGARIAALATQKAALESGRPHRDDPQFAVLDPIAPAVVARTLKDADTVAVGSITLTAHATPVHAPGSTSWTWRSCAGAGNCRTITYADSSSTISADGYRFSNHPARVAQIRRGLPVMAGLPCDILLTPHPGQSAMMERFAGRKPLSDASACRAYAKAAQVRFEDRLSDEGRK